MAQDCIHLSTWQRVCRMSSQVLKARIRAGEQPLPFGTPSRHPSSCHSRPHHWCPPPRPRPSSASPRSCGRSCGPTWRPDARGGVAGLRGWGLGLSGRVRIRLSSLETWVGCRRHRGRLMTPYNVWMLNLSGPTSYPVKFPVRLENEFGRPSRIPVRVWREKGLKTGSGLTL